MSLPTYVRRPKWPDLVGYLTEGLRRDGREVDENLVRKILRLREQWSRDHEGYYINPVKRHVRPFWLTPTKQADLEVTVPANGQVKEVEFQVDSQGHFEALYSEFQATDPRFTVFIRDDGLNRNLMNQEILAQLIAGNAERPFIWPESYFVNTHYASRSLLVNFRDLSGSENKIRWTFTGRRWYQNEAPPEVAQAMMERWGDKEKTYTYFLTADLPRAAGVTLPAVNFPFVTLTSGETLRENNAPFFQVVDQEDTEIRKLGMLAFDANQNALDADVLFRLRDDQTGRILSNGQVNIRNGWGDGQYPFVFPEGFFMQRNYKLRLELTNQESQTILLFPVLVCRRLKHA